MYDKSQQYKIPFIGGPFDGKEFSLLPADRQVLEERARNGMPLKNHIWNLRETINRENGEVVKLEYVYQE